MPLSPSATVKCVAGSRTLGSPGRRESNSNIAHPLNCLHYLRMTRRDRMLRCDFAWTSQVETYDTAQDGGDLMSAWADYSATDTQKGHARVSCLDGDLVARAVIDGLLKLRPAFLEDPNRSNAGQVLLASSEQVLA